MRGSECRQARASAFGDLASRTSRLVSMMAGMSLRLADGSLVHRTVGMLQWSARRIEAPKTKQQLVS
jgi:hypothetical protein